MKTKPKTLIIDDNPADIELLKIAFQKADIESDITTKTDGDSALDYLFELKKANNKEDIPMLVILDLNMPKTSGKDVLKGIKEDEELRKIPVIILSTSDVQDDVQDCYSLHANSYLIKPSDFDHFSEMIEAIKEFWFNKNLRP